MLRGRGLKRGDAFMWLMWLCRYGYTGLTFFFFFFLVYLLLLSCTHAIWDIPLAECRTGCEGIHVTAVTRREYTR